MQSLIDPLNAFLVIYRYIPFSVKGYILTFALVPIALGTIEIFIKRG